MDANETAQRDLEYFVASAHEALDAGYYERAAALTRLAANAYRQMRPADERARTVPMPLLAVNRDEHPLPVYGAAATNVMPMVPRSQCTYPIAPGAVCGRHYRWDKIGNRLIHVDDEGLMMSLDHDPVPQGLHLEVER